MQATRPCDSPPDLGRDAPALRSVPWIDAIALILAIASVVAWYAVAAAVNPGVIHDERTHYRVIEGLLAGRWPRPGQIPMLPTAHLLIAGVLKLAGPSLLAARSVSAALTLAAAWLVWSAARFRFGRGGGLYALILLWNPVFFPYCALVYTEPAALLAMAAAVHAHVRGRYGLAAAAMTAACLVRQSNILWAALLLMWGLMEPGQRGRRALVVYTVPIALFGAALVLWPDWVLQPSVDHRVRFNIAQFYLFFFIASVVWAPLWLAALVRRWKAEIEPRLVYARIVVVLVAAVGLLAMAFDNPHHWNSDPNYLHDRILVTLYASGAARLALAALLVTAVPLIFVEIWRSPGRWRQMSAWIFAVLFLLPHPLVDHRYYLFPLLFVNLLAAHSPTQVGRLASWHFILSAAGCAYLAMHGGPDSGL